MNIFSLNKLLLDIMSLAFVCLRLDISEEYHGIGFSSSYSLVVGLWLEIISSCSQLYVPDDELLNVLISVRHLRSLHL